MKIQSTNTWYIGIILVLNAHAVISAPVAGTEWDINTTFDSIYKRGCPTGGSQNSTSTLLPGTLVFETNGQYSITLKNGIVSSMGSYTQNDNTLTLTADSHMVDRKQAATYLPSILLNQKIVKWLSLGKKNTLPKEVSFTGTVSEENSLNSSIALEENRTYKFPNGTPCSNNWTLKNTVKGTSHVVNSKVVSLTGILKNEGGTGVSGVKVVAMERTTKEKISGMTGGDGSFQLQAPHGVYDIGFDHEGDAALSTSFYGPVVLSSDDHRDFVMKTSGLRPVGSLSGTIYLKAGQPAAYRRIRLRPAVSLSTDQNSPDVGLMCTSDGGTTLDSDDPCSPFYYGLWTVTDEEGHFELSLGTDHEIGMDVEVYNEDGKLDEFVAIAKRDKPAYVEFVTEESPVEDTYRYDEEPPTMVSNPIVKGGDTNFKPFKIEFSNPGMISQNYQDVLFKDGNIPVNGVNYTFGSLGNFYLSSKETIRKALFDAEEDTNEKPTIRVSREGSWWYDYEVQVKTNRNGRFKFTDASGDTYSLKISFNAVVGVPRSVSYNSNRPDIVQIEFCDYSLPYICW